MINSGKYDTLSASEVKFGRNLQFLVESDEGFEKLGSRVCRNGRCNGC